MHKNKISQLFLYINGAVVLFIHGNRAAVLFLYQAEYIVTKVEIAHIYVCNFPVSFKINLLFMHHNARGVYFIIIS